MTRTLDFEKYLNHIKDYYYKYKIIPSFEVVKSILGLKSKGSVTRIFSRMIEYGYITKEGNKFNVTQKFLSYEYYESVKAGFPTPGNEDTKSDLNIEEYLVENPFSTFLIKVKGDSMINAGILEGDVVVVDKSKKAKLGDIVIGLIDNEFTLKYYNKDNNGKICLIPANDNYPILYPTEELQIFGVVVGTIRKYN